MQAQHRQLFDPPLPEAKVAAINALGVGVVDKIYVHFGPSGEAPLPSPGQSTGSPVSSFAKVSQRMSQGSATHHDPSHRAKGAAHEGSEPGGSPSSIAASHIGHRTNSAAAPSSEESASASDPGQLDSQSPIAGGRHASQATSKQGRTAQEDCPELGEAGPQSQPATSVETGSAAEKRSASNAELSPAGASQKKVAPVVSYHLLWRGSNAYAQKDAESGAGSKPSHASEAEPANQFSAAVPGQEAAESLPGWTRGLCNLRFGGSEFIQEAAAATPSVALVRDHLSPRPPPPSLLRLQDGHQ